jgi:hypothetical protein
MTNIIQDGWNHQSGVDMALWELEDHLAGWKVVLVEHANIFLLGDTAESSVFHGSVAGACLVPMAHS